MLSSENLLSLTESSFSGDLLVIELDSIFIRFWIVYTYGTNSITKNYKLDQINQSKDNYSRGRERITRCKRSMYIYI